MKRGRRDIYSGHNRFPTSKHHFMRTVALSFQVHPKVALLLDNDAPRSHAVTPWPSTPVGLSLDYYSRMYPLSVCLSWSGNYCPNPACRPTLRLHHQNLGSKITARKAGHFPNEHVIAKKPSPWALAPGGVAGARVIGTTGNRPAKAVRMLCQSQEHYRQRYFYATRPTDSTFASTTTGSFCILMFSHEWVLACTVGYSAHIP